MFFLAPLAAAAITTGGLSAPTSALVARDSYKVAERDKAVLKRSPWGFDGKIGKEHKRVPDLVLANPADIKNEIAGFMFEKGLKSTYVWWDAADVADDFRKENNALGCEVKPTIAVSATTLARATDNNQPFPVKPVLDNANIRGKKVLGALEFYWWKLMMEEQAKIVTRASFTSCMAIR